MNKKNQISDIVESAAQWIEEAGFKEDLSDLTAGLHDIVESIDEIRENLLPSLLRLEPPDKNSDPALGIIISLTSEMEHINNHARDAFETLVKVQGFFDKQHKINK